MSKPVLSIVRFFDHLVEFRKNKVVQFLRLRVSLLSKFNTFSRPLRSNPRLGLWSFPGLFSFPRRRNGDPPVSKAQKLFAILVNLHEDLGKAKMLRST